MDDPGGGGAGRLHLGLGASGFAAGEQVAELASELQHLAGASSPALAAGRLLLAAMLASNATRAAAAGSSGAAVARSIISEMSVASSQVAAILPESGATLEFNNTAVQAEQQHHHRPQHQLHHSQHHQQNQHHQQQQHHQQHQSTWSLLIRALTCKSSAGGRECNSSTAAADDQSMIVELNWPIIGLALLMVALISSTIIGNLFVMVAILIERNLRTIGNYLVLSLAIADLLVAVLVMPLAGIYQILDSWTLGVLLCDIWTSADVFCCTASILHLLAIALDRYWAVTRVDYIRCQRNERRILFMILFVWMAAGVISLAPALGWKDHLHEQRITRDLECLVSQDIGYQIFATCTTFYFPLILTLIFYWKIYQVARKRIRRKPGNRLKISLQQPSSSSSVVTPSGTPAKQHLTSKQHSPKPYIRTTNVECSNSPNQFKSSPTTVAQECQLVTNVTCCCCSCHQLNDQPEQVTDEIGATKLHTSQRNLSITNSKLIESGDDLENLQEDKLSYSNKQYDIRSRKRKSSTITDNQCKQQLNLGDDNQYVSDPRAAELSECKNKRDLEYDEIATKARKDLDDEQKIQSNRLDVHGIGTNTTPATTTTLEPNEVGMADNNNNNNKEENKKWLERKSLVLSSLQGASNKEQVQDEEQEKQQLVCRSEQSQSQSSSCPHQNSSSTATSSSSHNSTSNNANNQCCFCTCGCTSCPYLDHLTPSSVSGKENLNLLSESATTATSTGLATATVTDTTTPTPASAPLTNTSTCGPTVAAFNQQLLLSRLKSDGQVVSELVAPPDGVGSRDSPDGQIMVEGSFLDKVLDKCRRFSASTRNRSGLHLSEAPIEQSEYSVGGSCKRCQCQLVGKLERVTKQSVEHGQLDDPLVVVPSVGGPGSSGAIAVSSASIAASTALFQGSYIAGASSATAMSRGGPIPSDGTSSSVHMMMSHPSGGGGEGVESKREKKAAKTLAIITGVFVICWLPFFVMAIAMPVADLRPPKYIFALLLWLGYLNSMLNPIIYTIFSPDFRKAFKRLLCGLEQSRAENHRRTFQRRTLSQPEASTSPFARLLLRHIPPIIAHYCGLAKSSSSSPDVEKDEAAALSRSDEKSSSKAMNYNHSSRSAGQQQVSFEIGQQEQNSSKQQGTITTGRPKTIRNDF